MYYYRARFYDPSIGRFVSQDPIGFNAGDHNLYRYVSNAPLGYVDPSGMTSLSEWAVLTSMETALNSACAFAELWAQDKLDDPWEIAQEVSKALLFSAVGAVIGSGLSFNISLKTLFSNGVRAVALNIGVGMLSGFVTYDLGDALISGAATNDFRLFWIRFACTAANIALVPIAAGITQGLRGQWYSQIFLNTLDNIARRFIERNTKSLADYPIGAIFSGVFDPITRRFIMRPSGATRLRTGAVPANNQDPPGGFHAVINESLALITSYVNPNGTIGFTARVSEGNKLIFSTQSISVNHENWGVEEITDALQIGQISDALSSATGMAVQWIPIDSWRSLVRR